MNLNCNQLQTDASDVEFCTVLILSEEQSSQFFFFSTVEMSALIVLHGVKAFSIVLCHHPEYILLFCLCFAIIHFVIDVCIVYYVTCIAIIVYVKFVSVLLFC